MSTANLSSEDLAFVCTMVRDRAAIELDASKAYLIDARLAPLAKQNGYGSPAEFVQGVRSSRVSSLESSLVEAMTTNETSFFRDLHPFDALQKHVIPELQSTCAVQRSLNIWSAACASGQELYSIAMLLHEHFPGLASWDVQLLGTDLSDDVLQQARDGRYSQVEVNRGLPAPLLVKYFERDRMHWQLKAELRNLATFRKMNLIEAWPPMPKMDIVFLRNVLIYFSTENKKRILDKIHGAMAPHGLLFLGGAENTIGLETSFERIQIGSSFCYRLA